MYITNAVLSGPTVRVVGEGVFDLPAHTIEATLLVAPLRSVDTFLQRIPVVRAWTADGLVTIPVKVSGPFNNPTVRPLDPALVGSRLANFAEQTLKFPLRIMQPFLPGGGRR